MSGIDAEQPPPSRYAPAVARAYVASRVRTGWQRVRGALVPNTQAAVFAALSWAICYYLLGEPNPIFAPIATYLCLGFSRNREPRKVLEVALGATLGVAIGELSVHLIGFGAWQILLLFLLTPLIARFIDGADFVTFQTSINAVVVGSMSLLAASAGSQSATGRWTDAVVGGLVALVGAIVLPSSLTTRPRRYTVTALREVATALDSVGAGLRDGDADEVRAAYGSLAVARTQITEGEAARSSAADLAALNPVRRTERLHLVELKRLLDLTDRLHTSVAMLSRQAAGMTSEAGSRRSAGERTEALARATRQLADEIGDWQRPEQARRSAVDIAATLSPGQAHDECGWRSSALFSLLRAIAVDLLQLSGLSMVQARTALADTEGLDARRQDRHLPAAEQGSGMWGTGTLPVVGDDDPPADRTPPGTS